jgi:predicted Fe-Mo cluster-binding NifX family protein
MGSPVRASDRVVRFSTKTDSLAGMEVESDVVSTVDAEARSISAAEQGTANSASSFNARQDRTTTAVRQTGRNHMGGFYSLRK